MNSWSVRGISHIGLAPKDPAKARWFFSEALGLPCLGEELVKEQETLTVMFQSRAPATPVADDDQRLELLVPEDGNRGPIAKFLEKKGSGIHHVALSVTGLDLLLVQLQERGVRLIDQTPRCGAHHTRIAFVHPESTGGLLVELVESRSSPP